MNKEKSLRIRLSEEDFNRLQAYARRKDTPMSQIVRDYIRKLPKEEKSPFQSEALNPKFK